MLTALTDLNAYASASSPLHTAYPQLLTSDDLLNVGDVNRSGSVSNGDIQALLDLVNGVPGAGSLTAVPEPSTLVLAVFGLTSAGLVRPRTRKKSSQPA